VASYTVSLLHPAIIDDLHLARHGLRILSRKINNYVPLENGDAFTGYPDHARMRAETARFSESDAVALDEYYRLLDRVVAVIKDVMMMTPPELTDAGLGDLIKLFGLSRRFRRLDDVCKRFLLKLFAASAGEVLDDLFESDGIKAMLGFDAVVGHFASPYAPGSGYVLLHHVVGEVNGKPGTWGHAVGGMGAITEAMAQEAISLGVQLLTDCAVAEVLVRQGRAIGARSIDGTEFNADLVVANINPKLLYCNLLDESVVDPETRRHFTAYKCQSGTFRMNVALSELPRFSSAMPEHCLEGGIIMAPSLAYMDQAYVDAKRDGWSASPIVEMLVPSVVDDSLAPIGKHVASLFCQQFDPLLGEDWNTHRDEAAAAILGTVNRFAPNFERNIIATEIHSPWDLEQKFGLVGGDIFHGRLSLDQLFSARPMLGMGQYRTDIENLWLCGAGTHPGGGVSGIPGHNAAREIIRRL
jgi:phytoene dehydrogenase-like protein